MIGALRDQIQRMAGTDPERALRLVLSWIPGHRKPVVTELGGFFEKIHELGPPDPPPWARDIFREVGSDSLVSPELLAALSFVATSWDPYGSRGRVGLLGIPDLWIQGDAEEYRARFQELADGDRGAALRVYRGTVRGVELLKERVRELQSYTGALELYLQEGHSRDQWADPTEELENLLFAYLILLGRSVGEEGEEELEGAAA